MEAPVFLLFAFAVGYLMYWTVVNEKRDPNGGYEGWFAIRKPKGDNAQIPTNQDRNSWLRR